MSRTKLGKKRQLHVQGSNSRPDGFAVCAIRRWIDVVDRAGGELTNSQDRNVPTYPRSYPPQDIGVALKYRDPPLLIQSIVEQLNLYSALSDSKYRTQSTIYSHN